MNSTSISSFSDLFSPVFSHQMNDIGLIDWMLLIIGRTSSFKIYFLLENLLQIITETSSTMRNKYLLPPYILQLTQDVWM